MKNKIIEILKEKLQDLEKTIVFVSSSNTVVQREYKLGVLKAKHETVQGILSLVNRLEE